MSRGNRNNRSGSNHNRSDRRLRNIERMLGVHGQGGVQGQQLVGSIPGVGLGAQIPGMGVAGGMGMTGTPATVNPNRKILQVIPTQDKWSAVYATEDGKPFQQTVAAFALVEDRTFGRAVQRSVVPLTSSGRGLELADESINYLGTVEPGENAQKFEQYASTFAQNAKQFQTGSLGGRIRHPITGEGSRQRG